MKLLEKLLKIRQRDFVVIAAHADGPQRLFVALEVFEHQRDTAVTCVIAVHRETLAVELVHEARGSSIDYLTRDGWHGLLQRDAVIELGGPKPVVTKAAKLGSQGTLAAIARKGTTTFVSGTKHAGKYAIDGFVAQVAKGKLAMVMETSKLGIGALGSINTLAVGPSGTIHAAGSAMGEANRRALFRGTTKFTGVAVAARQIYALHELPDGTVLVGGDEEATVVRDGVATSLTGVVGRVDGVTTFRGTELWMSHDSEHLILSRRSGTKLAKKYRGKVHFIGYRGLDGTPTARMTATDDLLVVTNKDRIHVFDGKTWTQLGLHPDVKKLVKSLPAGLKA